MASYSATAPELWYQQQQQRYQYQQAKEVALQQEQEQNQQHPWLAQEVQQYEDLESKMNATFGNKNPVSMLMEFGQYLRQHVEFKEPVPCSGPDHIPRFTIAAVVGSRTFAPCEAGNKKDGRCGASLLAWTALMEKQQQKFNRIIADDDKTWCDKIAACAHLEYLQQVERHPQGFCGRKVLAAIVLKKKQKKGRKDLVKVISLGTGNRTILSAHLDMNGKPVNDCHAELIARRACLRYLYSEVKAVKNGSKESILERCENTGQLKLRFCYSFHLYISTAPCGDAALFNRTDDEHDPMAHQPIFDSNVQGLLRTKIEAGEGTIPVEKGYIQTWIGLQFGNRLRTMSCSDKICKWNVVGLQGALLSHFMLPIYLTSVTVGDNFFWGHMARGLYYRLEVDGKTPVKWQLPAGYGLSSPELGHTDLEDMVVDTEKSSPITVSWTVGDPRADVLDGTTGKHLEEEEGQLAPNVSKESLYEEFRSACGMYDMTSLLGAATYRDAKMAAKDYQAAKEELFRIFDQLGYGKWVHKPPEVDFFPS